MNQTSTLLIAAGIITTFSSSNLETSPSMKYYYSMDWLELEDEIRDVKMPTKGYLHLCSTVGCQKRTRIMMSRENIEQATAIMSLSVDPKTEREALQRTIAYFERETCARNSTCFDRPNVSFFTSGQKDCVDEATNTTTYLLWLQNHSLLRYHKVLVPDTSGFPMAHWFARIRSTNGADFIVESDFNRTGEEPNIYRR